MKTTEAACYWIILGTFFSNKMKSLQNMDIWPPNQYYTTVSVCNKKEDFGGDYQYRKLRDQ